MAPSGFSVTAATYSLGVTIRFDRVGGAVDSMIRPRAVALPVTKACNCRPPAEIQACSGCGGVGNGTYLCSHGLCPHAGANLSKTSFGCLLWCTRRDVHRWPEKQLEEPLTRNVRQFMSAKAEALGDVNVTRWLSFADALTLGTGTAQRCQTG